MTIRFSHADDYIELNIVEVEELPQVAGDTRMLVEVQSSGFKGDNDVWVSVGSFLDFCSSLVELAEKRSGEAQLESISPNELDLVIRPVDSVGHFGVFGTTGYHVIREHGSVFHSVSFGFEFDPAQLRDASRIDWVKANVS